jgi:hypothetical protein
MNGRNNYELPMTNYFKNHNPKPDHRTDSPSERGAGGVGCYDTGYRMTNYFKNHKSTVHYHTDSLPRLRECQGEWSLSGAEVSLSNVSAVHSSFIIHHSSFSLGVSVVYETTINSLKSNNPTPTLPFPKGEGEELISHKGAFGFFILAPRFIGVEKAHKPQILNGFKRFESASANIPPVSPLSQRGENPKNRKSVIDHDFYFRPIHRETCWERSLSGAEVSLSNVLAVHSSFIIYHSNVPPSLRPSISPSLHPPSLRPLVPSPFRPFVSSSLHPFALSPLRLFVPPSSIPPFSVPPSLLPSVHQIPIVFSLPFGKGEGWGGVILPSSPK